MDKTEGKFEINHGGRFDKSEGRRSSLFCDHCKRPGHSIDKCYKIHGYPQQYKFKGGRKTVALARANDEENMLSASEFHAPSFQRNFTVSGLTQEQSSQLIALLQNAQINQQSYNDGPSYQASNLNQNPNSAAFTSFTVALDYTQSLCLLSSFNNWEYT